MSIGRTLSSFGVQHLPLPAGKYTVGCRDVIHGIGKNKGTLMRLYYPCEPPTDPASVPGCWTPWLPEHDYIHGYAAHSGAIVSRLFRTVLLRLLEDVYIPALFEAPPLAGPFPVIVWSHGISGCRTSYATLCCQLASLGYVIAALEHRDHTACATFYYDYKSVDSPDANAGLFQGYEELTDIEAPHLRNLQDLGEFDPSVEEENGDAQLPAGFDELDGSLIQPNATSQLKRLWIPYRKIAKGADFYLVRHGQVLFRVKECIRAVNVLEQIAAGKVAAARTHAGTLSLSHVCIAGHSLGAATALMALRADTRFTCGLILDPWMFPLRREQLIPFRQPILCILLERFQTRENVRLLQQQNSSSISRKFITIKGAAHVNHSDVPFLTDSRVMRYAFGDRFRIGRFKALQLTLDLSAIFLEGHLVEPLKDPNEQIEEYAAKGKRHLRTTLRLPGLFG